MRTKDQSVWHGTLLIVVIGALVLWALTPRANAAVGIETEHVCYAQLNYLGAPPRIVPCQSATEQVTEVPDMTQHDTTVQVPPSVVIIPPNYVQPPRFCHCRPSCSVGPSRRNCCRCCHRNPLIK